MQQGSGDDARASSAAISYEELAQVLAEDPDMVERLLAAHVASDRGLCAACRDQRPPRWPCGPRQLAERAREIQKERRGW